ncbi:phosphopantetheine-binding protein [Ensifer psoraleae]|uniref:Phosphopantetheine-binding protein n=1 Tax=Sinorhizobium psoraleae TaxID=520838 RepID=A0ABT4KNT1_9HYPH|nr:phosphopantetheine-binding protein [Sinorhizobium psoraleae]MCZ4093489.1 phosphopantetheine-binding protein [Sinorhizobium psoraleae]
MWLRKTADEPHEADGAELAAALRAHLGGLLPDYMVPSAFVRLEALPLTANGKLDRKALPVPDDDAYARRAYAAPQGAVETALAAIWAELLGIERVGRHDHFFELGGHSLLAVQLMERLRRQSLGVEVRTLFARPVLCDLAASLGSHHEVVVPANRISEESTAITPQMLPLIDLTQEEIDRVVSTVPGGVGNIQDIYGLSPLQDGILFHHLLATEGDPICSSVRWPLPIEVCWTATLRRCNRWSTATTSCAPPLSGRACRARPRWSGARRRWRCSKSSWTSMAVPVMSN